MYELLRDNDIVLLPAMMTSCAVVYDKISRHPELNAVLSKYEPSLWRIMDAIAQGHARRVEQYVEKAFREICEVRVCTTDNFDGWTIVESVNTSWERFTYTLSVVDAENTAASMSTSDHLEVVSTYNPERRTNMDIIHGRKMRERMPEIVRSVTSKL